MSDGQVIEVGDAPNITRLIEFEEQKATTFRSSWSSPEKFAKHILDGNEKDCWYNGNVYKDTSPSFSGVNSVAEAVDMCYNGWTEGGALIEKTRGYIQALNPLSPKMVKYGIAGSTPNVPRAIAGNILNMRMPEKRASTKRKTITIVYNMCESGWTEKDNISNKAAVTAALIDEIEAKGFSCEVIAMATTQRYNDFRAATCVCVKESHHPVDINRLAFSLGHVAMFRVMFFADWQKDDRCKDLGYGLGTVSTSKAGPEANAAQVYTIESGHEGNIPIRLFKDIEMAAKEGLNKIVWALQKQGCPAFPPLKENEDGVEPDEEDEDEEPHWSY